MEAKFWHQTWSDNRLGFHQPKVNGWLQKHWPAFGLAPETEVLVPLCGKSLDMRWLAEAGFGVRGVELSRIAVDAFFEDSDAVRVERSNKLERISDAAITIFCGDFFDLTAADLTPVGGVFDRGALVALPPEMRQRYVDHKLDLLASGAVELLLALEYDQTVTSGPPFSVEQAEIEELYGPRCDVVALDRVATNEVPPRFKERGIEQFAESVYKIVKR